MAEFGNWALVIASVLLFTAFSLGFLIPFKKRDWRSLGIYQGFLVALFTEMFGFPLTLYILTSLLGFDLPISLKSGHIFVILLEKVGFSQAYLGVHVVSVALMLAGFALIIWGWRKVYNAGDRLVKDGPYRYTRNPQYLGIYCIVAGLLIMWPTFLTLAMLPVLVLMYYRLAEKEEAELEREFGEEYIEYRRAIPMFLPVRAG